MTHTDFKEKDGFAFGEILTHIILWPIALGFSACLFILLSQCLKFLQSGTWPSISVVDALRFFGSEWATYPDAWLGVHNFLNSLPVSIGAVILGFLPLSLFVLVARSSAR